MQMVKIQIPDKADSARAFATLIRRGRIDCYRDEVYIVPEPALQVLKDLGITYHELGRGGIDYAEKRFEILLPLKYNDGSPVPDELLNQTRDELVTRFDALTGQPRGLIGVWRHEGQLFEDELACVTIDVEDSEENLLFFSNLKTTLMERFQQLEIYIISYPIERI